jgi:hypothetical protein
MQINSAVELCGGTVIFHSVRQKVPRGTDYVSSHAGKCLNTSPPVRPDVKQKPKGLRSEYQFAAANSHRPFSFDQQMKFDYHRCIAQITAGGCGWALDVRRRYALSLKQTPI